MLALSLTCSQWLTSIRSFIEKELKVHLPLTYNKYSIRQSLQFNQLFHEAEYGFQVYELPMKQYYTRNETKVKILIVPWDKNILISLSFKQLEIAQIVNIHIHILHQLEPVIEVTLNQDLAEDFEWDSFAFNTKCKLKSSTEY